MKSNIIVEIENETKALLTEKRFLHSINVKNTALKLGKLYNADENKIEIAAITHDCVKCFSDDKLFELAQELNVEIDDIQKNSPQLLHGPVGSAYCSKKFNIQDIDILNAIYYHTTGRVNMSILEKIIYLADMIEDSRDFKGVDDIRKASLLSIDKALLMSCNTTINYLLNKNQLIHPLTIEFRNSLILKGGTSNEQD